ncbi:hypothetical protein AAG570_001052 [Ranatra chinensis]|uniref:Reverse transcriptase domain-containing protein n=1 Tax=Ranatra chinensis TaxID=642074 RepID=A0ABD0YYX2_9HEMI
MGARIEPYKIPKTSLQCHNCQRLGHGTQGCPAERRCVKCGLSHLAKECKKTKEEFRGALCGGNHTATYRGCPTYKNLGKQAQERKFLRESKIICGNTSKKVAAEKKNRAKHTRPDRQFRVKIDEIFSDWKPIKAGLPQGSLLGPILFNLYVNDLPAPPETKVAMYADDTAFLVQSWKPSLVSDRLQGALDIAAAWFSRWRMRGNPSKCAALFFTKRLKHKPIGLLQIDGEGIPWSKSTKYLGVMLDCQLSWNHHVNGILKKANCRFSQLYPLIDLSPFHQSRPGPDASATDINVREPCLGGIPRNQKSISYRYSKIRSSEWSPTLPEPPSGLSCTGTRMFPQ